MNLCLIGGGDKDPLITDAIKEVESPNVLIVPSACSTPNSYNRKVKSYLELFKHLGLPVRVLHDFGGSPTEVELAEKFGGSSIVCTPGGHSPSLIKNLENHGSDRYLKESILAKKLYIGTSAGALVVFKEALICPAKRPDEEEWDFEYIAALGLLGTVATAHANKVESSKTGTRLDYLVDRLPDEYETGLGIDNNAALVIKGDRADVLRSDKQSTVHVVVRSQGDTACFPVYDPDELSEIVESIPVAENLVD